jgi:hypothetical protein
MTMTMTEQETTREINQQLPIAKGEDVEFAEELADSDDKEAQERANAADYRQEED